MLLPFDASDFSTDCALLDQWATRLDERILSRRWEGRMRRALEAETVAASTRMEGVPVTVADTLKILAGDRPESVAVADSELVLGYRDAMTYVQRRADDGNLQWNRELIVGVQDRVLAGRLGAGAGRLRDGAAWVRNEATGQTVFQPPDYELVPGLVDEACRQVEAADWHPALAAAWMHVAIAAVHPFRDGNGRTARVLASLAMYGGGFRHPAFTSLEEWWGRHASSYYQAFACLGDAFDRSADVTEFVRVHLAAHLEQVAELALRQQIEGLLYTTLENLLADLGLPERIANGLYDTAFGRDVTTGYYRDLIALSTATARNDLTAAVAAGLLSAEGRTRGRRYLVGPRLFPLVSQTLGDDVEPDPQSIMLELAKRADLAGTLGQADAEQPRLPGLDV
jgi:Fic family protein